MGNSVMVYMNILKSVVGRYCLSSDSRHNGTGGRVQMA